MRLFQYLCMFIAATSIQAKEVYIPEAFKEGQIIEQLILICDVDGVIRESVEAVADPRIITAVRTLLEHKNVDVTFISGTPIDNDLSLEQWRRGNIPLKRVFGSCFEKELSQGRVAIYGVLGGHRMNTKGGLEIVDEYALETSFELSRLLLHAFLKEVEQTGNRSQRALASSLRKDLNSLQLKDLSQSTHITALEFQSIVSMICAHFDPGFRLVNNGALVETHTTHPLWNTGMFCEWMREELNKPQHITSMLDPVEKQIAAGVAKRGVHGLNYFLISKTNKGIATRKHIEEKIQQFPHALIVTIGDTQVDFPMHQNAHLAFHVGMEKVWRSNPLPQCMMVRNEEGEDSQHLEGTLKVLHLLGAGLGKSFYDLQYIPKVNESGQWNFFSLRDLDVDEKHE